MSGLRFVLLPVFLLLTVAALALDPMTGHIVKVNERPMISLRDFAEIFDATVDYDVERNEISITLYDTTVYMVPYRLTAWVNNRKVWLDLPAVIIDDVTYLPVCFICEAFRLDSDWITDNRQVVIINRWTTIRIVLIFDTDWCRRPHVWRHGFDFRWYVNFHHQHHDVDWKRQDASPPYDGHDQYNDKDQYHGGPPPHDGANPPDGGRDKYNEKDKQPVVPPPHDGANPPDGGRDKYNEKDKQNGGPSPNNGIDPPNGSRDKNRENDNRRDYGPPAGNVPPGGYGKPTGKPYGDAPLWKHDPRQPNVVPPINFPLKFDWIRDGVVIRPNDGPQRVDPTPKAVGPQPGNQDKGQKAGPQDNDRREKESKGQDRDKDSSDKGDEKESKDKHRDK